MVLVEIEWVSGRWHRVKFGKAIGIHLWSPPEELPPVRTYPYIAYDYTPFVVAKWEGQAPSIHVGDVPEGTLLYLYNYVQKSRRWGLFWCALAEAKEGETVEYNSFWEAKNVKELIDKTGVNAQAVRLTLAAKRRGWSIARSTREENLIAVWAVEEGLISETPVKPNPEAGIQTAAEPLRFPRISRWL